MSITQAIFCENSLRDAHKTFTNNLKTEAALLWTIAGKTHPQEQSTRYSKLYSCMFVLSLLGTVIGTAMGGYLGKFLTILPFVIQVCVSASAIIPLLFVPERYFTVLESDSKCDQLIHLEGFR